MQAANFIHNEKNEVLNAKLVARQKNDGDIRSCILENRENSGRFFCTVCEISGKITAKTQIKMGFKKGVTRQAKKKNIYIYV